MKTKAVLASTSIVVALALVLAPLVISESASAFSWASQSISQSQSNTQSSFTVGLANLFSGNNFQAQTQSNTGSNVG